ncbi:hypothetical protein NEOLEDRAFT_1155173 [Neolentinus lepideus HHB14362 ss-1]|uniref:Saccharopine dehydrogenase NADP binding domain-containing protein n=1 Tax=Neolentinus lepideus HHB14362 ss-1 TaxID=1314782 RepID=A0A165TSF3_9AGAM|nr:hypothetical protein NEOLEDRAFT_1155173 [Neolentinus lepideus HHB14362 ss-1]
MVDIIVVGATGYTGRLASRYLSRHPQRKQFTLALGARSLERLSKIARELELENDVELFQIDVTDPESVDRAVINSKVVINTVGPYWRWGENVVRACVKHGKGYVDLTAEPHWVRRMVFLYDYFATKTGAIIIPACGVDSIPSDVSVYLGNKTLKSVAGPEANIEGVITAFVLQGGLSGGTLSSLLTALEEVPKEDLQRALEDYSLSTAIQGPPNYPSQLIYKLPLCDPPIYGSLFVMQPSNKAIVQRTWGLHQLAALGGGQKERQLACGPEFKYQECMKVPNAAAALAVSVFIRMVALALLLPPVRWALGKMLPPGTGPPESDLDKGRMEVTSITTSTPDAKGKRKYVRTVQKGHGDPGYLLTTIAVSESALAILLEKDRLPPLAQQGGILTPMSGMGDVLIERMIATGKFEFGSEVILTGNEAESRKTR